MGSANRRAAMKLAQGLILVALTLAAAIPAFAQNEPSPRDLAKRTVLVSIPDRKLAVIEDGDVLATFQIAVGAEVSPSPTGEFQIVNRVANPTYYHAGKVIPTGKDNPLGTRWLGLSEKGYGIHGTNVPRSVGHAASHGCIRLRNRDAERLFAMLRVGDVVEIRGERDDKIAHVFGGEDDDEIAEMAEPEQQTGK
jgi:lipoprotein-anchoring transpeptidase ErfK/SrfK